MSEMSKVTNLKNHVKVYDFLFPVGDYNLINQANINEKVWILQVSHPEMLRCSKSFGRGGLSWNDAEEKELPGRGRERTVWKGWKRLFFIAFLVIGY